jgi:hypothetical protein
MRKKYSLLLALLLLGASRPPHVYLGLQGLILTGAHTDIAGRQSGIAGGALIQFGVRGRRFGLHAEGIPPVSLPQAPSAFYGRATPQLSLINSAARFALDPGGDFQLGLGITVVNQRTPLPNISQVVSSRLAGARYEVAYRRSLANAHFVEAEFGGAPHLTGSDVYVFSDGSPAIVKPEIAAEEDALFAYGVARGNTEWLVGLRSIDFSARYALTGASADRNNGGGLLLEWRQFVR